MHAQEDARSVPAEGERAGGKDELPTRHVIDRRWLPREIWDRYWTEITPEYVPSAGDWIYDPTWPKHVAGRITKIVALDGNTAYIIQWDAGSELPYLRRELNAFWRKMGD